MFDDLSAMDWVFVVGALLLGFGIVKFMLSQSGAAVPPVEVRDTPVDPTSKPRPEGKTDAAGMSTPQAGTGSLHYPLSGPASRHDKAGRDRC